MKLFIAVIIGIVIGFISSGIQSSFISKRDRNRNSDFKIKLWKISWWIGGFIVGLGISLKYLN